MIEPDFLRRACARETADEQAALHDEILAQVAADDGQGTPAEVAAEAQRRYEAEIRARNRLQ